MFKSSPLAGKKQGATTEAVPGSPLGQANSLSQGSDKGETGRGAWRHVPTVTEAPTYHHCLPSAGLMQITPSSSPSSALVLVVITVTVL